MDLVHVEVTELRSSYLNGSCFLYGFAAQQVVGQKELLLQA